jgi:hypothetical protein
VVTTGCRRVAPICVEECLDVAARESAALGIRQQVARRLFGRQRGTIRPLRGQRIENVDDADDLGEEWDLVAAQRVGIAAPVQPFVMAQDDRPHPAQRLERRTERIANLRMPLHQLELLGGQRARLQQDRIGHADLADVVQIPAAVQRFEIVVAEPDRLTQPDGVAGEPLAVALGQRVARLDGERQGHERGLGRVQIVDQVLDARQRTHPRAQFVWVDRLGQELVRTRLDAADAIRQVRLAGHEDDRGQPSRRV